MLAIVSKIAGVELVPHTDYEIAHINISGTDVEKLNPLTPNAERVSQEQANGDNVAPSQETEAETVEQKNDAIVSWHTDSYPFVCVTMLSDCTNMVGGETALKTGSGEVVKVRGPQMVSDIPPRRGGE